MENVHKMLFDRYLNDARPRSVIVPDPSTVFQVPSGKLHTFWSLKFGDIIARINLVKLVIEYEEQALVKFLEVFNCYSKETQSILAKHQFSYTVMKNVRSVL